MCGSILYISPKLIDSVVMRKPIILYPELVHAAVCYLCAHHHPSVVCYGGMVCCNHSILITHSAELFASASSSERENRRAETNEK